MRQIKFRAWDKEEKKFVLSKDIGSQNIPTRATRYGFALFTNFELMQFTGLKDKNKKEIYEGDILRAKDGTIWTVRWSVAGFDIFCNTENLIKSLNNKRKKELTEDEEDAKLIGLWSYKKEVIGNIYENPELLEEEK